MCLAGEKVPAEEQFDKEKINAEVLALDNTINNDKFASTPSMPPMPGMLGARLTGVEKEKCEVELAKLYKQLDDKVHTYSYTHNFFNKYIWIYKISSKPP